MAGPEGRDETTEAAELEDADGLEEAAAGLEGADGLEETRDGTGGRMLSPQATNARNASQKTASGAANPPPATRHPCPLQNA